MFPPLVRSTSTWDETNHTHFLHLTLKLLSSTINQQCNLQKWALHFIRPTHTYLLKHVFHKDSLHEKQHMWKQTITMTTTNRLILPLTIQNFICLHKYVDVFLDNCVNVTWGMKGIEGPLSFVLINFHKMCLLHFKRTNNFHFTSINENGLNPPLLPKTHLDCIPTTNLYKLIELGYRNY